MSRTYLIKYAKPNIFTFQDVFSQDDVENEKDKHVRFVPGVNELSEGTYNALMGVGKKVLKSKNSEELVDAPAHPMFVKMLEGRPQLLSWIPGFSPEDKEVKKLSDLKENAALDVIEATYNVDLLNKFLDKEKRSLVVKTINDQIEKLKVPAQKVA